MSVKVLYGVYPWAFDCPGGGERQLMAYKRHLEMQGVQVGLYDQWDPRIRNYDIFHFFSAMPGSIQLCDFTVHKFPWISPTEQLILPFTWLHQNNELSFY